MRRALAIMLCLSQVTIAACSGGADSTLADKNPQYWTTDDFKLIVGPSTLRNAKSLTYTRSGPLCQVIDLGVRADSTSIDESVSWWRTQFPQIESATWTRSGITKILFVEDENSDCAVEASRFLAIEADERESETTSAGPTRSKPGLELSGTLIISSDLPLQGSALATNDSTNKAIRLYLEQIGYRVGPYQIEFKTYDNATAAKGSWDEATCAKNAQAHALNKNEVAVIGTYNSGCAKIIVPVLNQSPNGPMLMVSHANTNPGLTKTWDPGEPEKFYPTGRRNYARVIATDDYQGSAAAQFAAKDLGARRCYVLNDNQTYGQGVAKAFADEAAKQGITVLGNEAWDASEPDYYALFTRIKALGPDCVYLGGIFDNNGAQLVSDKVRILGNNSRVKLLAPDGFTGYPDLTTLNEAQGMYLTFAGLSADLLIAAGGAGAAFLKAYKAKYGSDPVGSYPLYGVAALQVILEAINIVGAGITRAKLTNAVLGESDIRIPQSESILGSELRVNSRTGDVIRKQITILVIRNGYETTLKSWTLQGS